MVDLRRFELPTPTMRMWCAPNCATSPYENYTAVKILCQVGEYGTAYDRAVDAMKEKTEQMCKNERKIRR